MSKREDSPDHGQCAATLRVETAALGVEVTVSTVPPIIKNEWIEEFTCPHGVTFWMEPTTDQRAQWAKDGVK